MGPHLKRPRLATEFLSERMARRVHAGDVPSFIVVSRDRGGWRDRARSYGVVVDGEQVASIKRGGRIEVPVASGRHEVVMRINWGTSQPIDVDVEPGESVELACRTGGAQMSVGYIGLSRV
jgi:hypothetical protein